MHYALLPHRLQTLVSYALKAERELWGLCDGPWDGAEHATHRRAWAAAVRCSPLCSPLK
jgi:hypothetical protein